ncbi:MAG: sigma factor-like helix-turn-helix DNA-binding protein, partial [Gammaproteobacteria bacterium]
RNWRIVKVATTKAQRKLFFNLRSAKKRLGWMNNEEVEAVAKDLGVTRRDVLEMEERLSARDAAYDSPVNEDEDETGFAPSGYLENLGPGPEQEAEFSQDDDLEQEQLTAALKSLDARSREIIQRRWLTDDKSTLHDLADEFGISAERIRQLEVAAMNKMRSAMAA